MGKGKYKMLTEQQFLAKKIIYDLPKKDPVWVYLEKEMRANIDKKPYNELVGEWLRFLRDLKYHYYCEARRKYKRLYNEIGPSWYCELSTNQREVLMNLKFSIHQDLLEDLPTRTRRSLSDLGITLNIQKSILMNAMTYSVEDPGVFIWNLYSAVYKRSPSEQRLHYDMNAMILMSCLVFIDLEECIHHLEKLTQSPLLPQQKPRKKQKQYFTPNVPYGEYLQEMYVPLYCRHPSPNRVKVKPKPFGYKFKLRSRESYERLCKDASFLEKRKKRNIKVKEAERVCNYKFWEAPCTLRNTNPKMAQYASKLKMMRLKAKAKHKAPYKNTQYLVGGVSYSGGTPQYTLTNIAYLPTGYIPINGGTVALRGEFITIIHGYWNFPKRVDKKCDLDCKCVEKWEDTIMEYIKKSKCRCAHLYDFFHNGKVKKKYFYPPNRFGPFWIDKAKVYQMDSLEDFVKDAVKDALLSVDPTPVASATILPVGLSEKEILAALLADLSETALLIPHLPQANLLNNLQEWVRKRLKGRLNANQHKQYMLQSLRRWLDLKHMDFRARAYRIPFTLKQLEHLNWSHRQLVQRLRNTLLEDFVMRNRIKQMEQTRLLWSTTKYDAYPSKPFLDIYFTYMPGRMKDTFLINPYSSELTPKYGAKTCPLS